MGYGRHDEQDWQDLANKRIGTKTKATEIYIASHHDQELNPANITMRESRDSDLNPNSTAVIIGVDTTGSMNPLMEAVAVTGLRRLVNGILESQPISDPHIMVMSVGDVYTDEMPIQMTQFEPDKRMLDQLLSIYPERRGGGNGSESYTAAWYLAAQKTSIDCHEKRGVKGFLFTIGDDCPARILEGRHIRKFFGVSDSKDYTAQELLNMVKSKYHVFHLVMEQGDNYRPSVLAEWKALIGDRAVLIDDCNKMPEFILGAMQVMAGQNPGAVATQRSVDPSILNAISNLK